MIVISKFYIYRSVIILDQTTQGVGEQLIGYDKLQFDNLILYYFSMLSISVLSLCMQRSMAKGKNKSYYKQYTIGKPVVHMGYCWQYYNSNQQQQRQQIQVYIGMMRINSQKKPKKSWGSRILRFVKQLFAQHSHLAKYLPLMTETKETRVCRLISDNSYGLASNESEMRSSVTRFIFPKLRVFMPTEPIMLIWYWLVFGAIMYYYVEMGLVLTYGQQVWEDEMANPIVIAFNVITILVLACDIFVCLNCGYLYRGMIVMDPRRITSYYMRNYGIIDFVSLLIVIICPASNYFYLNFAKLWLILKVGRLFQIDDFYLRKLNIHRKLKAVYVIFKLMVIIFLLSHTVGLIFYAIDYHLCASGRYEQQFCWLYSSTAYSPIISLDYSLQYLYTLYWGINTITTISYGDIAPNNPIETNYAILCFCFGFMVYGYVVNQIVKIILWAREHEDQFRAQLILIDTYMQKMSISRTLRKDVHDYLHFVHKEEKNRDMQMEAKMIQKIPEELRIQLLKNAYQQFYDKMLGIFMTPDIIRIFFYLTQKKFTHHQTVFDQGDRANALFYLSKGKIQYKVKHGTIQTKIYETLSQNQLIGHYEVFIRERWSYSAITTVSSLIYSIDRVKLMDEINSRAKLRERFKLIQSNLLFQKKCLMIYYLCFFCNKQHHFLECESKFPIFHLQCHLRFGQSQNHLRNPKTKQNILTMRKEMLAFKNIKNKDNYRLITKVEKRLAKIKRKIQQRNRQFQIDLAHDWEIYYPESNFSKIREKWNC